MSRANKLILFILFLFVSINFCPLVLAKENDDEPKQEARIEVPEVIVNRPRIEYKSASLRDPFQTYILSEKQVITQASATTDLSKPAVNFSELKVEGIIWGTKTPQAIINSKVYIVGDRIEDAEIISIDNKGITFNSASGIVNLAAPGQNSASGKVEQPASVAKNISQSNVSYSVDQSNIPYNISQPNVLNKVN